MNESNKNRLKDLWDLRHLTVNEFLSKIASHPDLKFLLTSVGIWFLVRWLIGLWIGGHVIYFVCRIFNVVFN